MEISLSYMQLCNWGDVYAHDNQSGAKAQTHLSKELEGRRDYRPMNFSLPTDHEEDRNAPW